MSIHIACLPKAGKQNPYQSLMIEGLNQSTKINAFNGVDDRFLGILRTVTIHKPDYLHFDWITSYYLRKKLWITLLFLPLFYIQILFISLFTKTKIVWTLHNIMPHNANHLFLHKQVRRFFAQHCDWIRLFSNDSVTRATNLLNIKSEKCIVIPEGDYNAIYPNNISQLDARLKLGIEFKKKVLLYIGFIKPYKGLEQLINEFSSIKTHESQLIIAGKGIDKAYTQHLISKIKLLNDSRIKLINEFIKVTDLQLYYNAANAVILPFDKVENSGSAIMAMGFKKAVLAPKIGVLEQRLKNQPSLLYNDLGNGLKQLLSLDQSTLDKLGLQNFLSLQDYKWSDFAQAFKQNNN